VREAARRRTRHRPPFDGTSILALVDLGLPGYRWVETIGRGGFGVVHRARDDAHGRDVAIKVLTGAFSDTAARRFDRERRAMGSVSSHPHICSVFTSGYTESGQPYFVMELLSGGSYADLMARGPIPVDEVVGVGIAVADALRVAHDAGILHCDVKPANILRSSYDTPMLSDFGIANLQTETVTVTGISATPAFAAPEVLQGEAATIRSDVYSLGATLYALIEGQLPYVRTGTENAFAVMNRVITEPVPAITRSDVPASLRALLNDAMAKDPARRPASMAEFRDAIAAVREGRAPVVPAQDTNGETVVGVAPLAAAPTPASLPDPAPLPPLESPSPQRRSQRHFVAAGIVAVIALIGVGTLVARSDGGSTATAAIGGTTTTVDPTATAPATTTTVTPSTTSAPSTTTTATPAPTTAPPSNEAPPLPTTIPTPVTAAALPPTPPPSPPSPPVPPPPTIPNVVGQRLPSAQATLDRAGYPAEWPGHCDNVVTAQSPPGGNVATLGTIVTLRLVPCIVPNIIGLRLPDAVGRIDAAGLTILWPNYCDDIVTSQFPGPGTELEPGDLVLVTLVAC
jgi:serine/threonine protein kinase